MATILVVDDRPESRAFLVALLGDVGHRLVEAADGREGLDRARAERPDLVIAGRLLPEADGYGLVRRLRAEAATASVPVIVHAATADGPGTEMHAEAGGFVFRVPSNTPPGEVVRAVERALSLGPAPPAGEPSAGDHPRLPADELARRVATLEASKVRLESLLDLGRLLAEEQAPDLLLRKYCEGARSIIGARLAAGFWSEGGMPFRTFVAVGMGTGEHDAYHGPVPSPGLLATLLGDRPSLRLPGPSGATTADGGARPSAAWRSLLGVPIVSRRRNLGALYLIEKVGGSGFDDSDERLAHTLAAQLAVAFENLRRLEEVREHVARLERETVERKRAEEALRQADERLLLALEAGKVGTWDWDLATDRVVWSRTLREIFGHPPGAFGGSYEEFARPIHPEDREPVARALREARDGRRDYVQEYRVVRPDRSVRWVVGRGRYSHDGGDGGTRMTGVVTDVTERKRAEGRLRESAARLKALTRRLIDVQETERRHLSRELHDEIGQALTALKLNVEGIPAASAEAAELRVKDSLAIIDQTIRQVRDLSLDLRPAMLDDLGLVAALRSYLNRQARRAGLLAEFVAEPSLARPTPEVETACFRVAQEAVTNALRYARARSVRIEIGGRGAELRLSVRDDGAGFDVEEARRRSRHGANLGLLGMQERVALVGGRLEIDSAPGRGTEVRALFPAAPEPSP